MTLPYASASSGTKAREEVNRILKHFGCSSIGWMDDYETNSVLLAFTRKGTNVQLRANAQGWANAYLKENPWSYRRRYTKAQWEKKAFDQGLIAVNSVLRDWVKGQITAIDTGVLTFEHVFFPYMLTSDGTPMIEHARKLLEPPHG